MRLRQIKLAGFKSFADPTLIELRDDFVGIVGPNGCGKSNVIDAVRWVLGEGRVSELRGSSLMTELIFSGSETRSPLGRASVELVLDNRDGTIKGPWGAYAELSVRRVVTSEGQSSYYINRQQVRRRDVQEIFMGTGLGPRSYAIISQGMIANFIKARPEELRGYLEEAAGVSVCRERRRETESHLRATNDNLERAQDLQTVRLAEVERLRADAGMAERWKSLSERRAEAEILWYALQHAEAKVSLEEVRAERVGREVELSERRAALAESRAAREPLEEAFIRAQEGHDAAVDAERVCERRLAERRGEARRLVERREEALRILAAAERTAAEKRTRLEEERARGEAEAEKLEADLETLDELEARGEEGEIALEAAESALRTAENRERGAREALEALRRTLSAEEATQEHRALRLSEIERTLAEAGAGSDPEPDPALGRALEARLAEASARAEEAEAAAEEAAERVEISAREASEADAAYFALLSEVKSLASRRDALEDIQEKIRGAEALEGWMSEQGLEGLARLAEALEIDEPCVRAFEAVLGERARALLLRDLTSARGFEGVRPPASLTFAAPAAPGPAETFPFPPVPLSPLLHSVRGTDPAVRSALSAWFSQTLFASTFAEAERYRKDLPDGWEIVTAAGDRITRASITFFAADAPESTFLSREREIRTLTERLETSEEGLGDADERRVTARSAARAAEAALTEARRAAAGALRAEGDAKLAAADFAAKHEAWGRREADRERSRTELTRERETVAAALADSSARIDETTDRLDDALKTMKRAAGDAESARGAAARVERRLAAERERISFLRLQVTQAREAARRRAGLEAEIAADIEREEARAAEARRTAEAINREAIEEGESEDAKKLERLVEASRIARETRDRARKALDANERIRRELEEAVLPLVEAAGNLRLEEGRRETLLAQFASRLSELGVELACAEALARAEPVRAATVRARVARLDAEIEALGPVNHAALAQLEEAERLMNETERQIEDIREAIRTLEEAIRRIDAETRARLRSTFEKVNAYFDETFRQLFGGGRAHLSMTGDEILSAGVEVSAQPPGKRNATVRQLSGGEQTLTATALVFAMFKLNPAPFCLLDEVDAPLDESNQARLAELCLKLAETTQFLLITHHRVTMEYAEALIGVTMREPGVSRVVSVDLEEAVSYAAEPGRS